MDVVKLFKRKLKAMKSSINKSVQASIKENDNILIDQQTEQFDEGKDSLGVNFVPSYSDYTIGIKQALRQPYNRVTLKDTGDLYDSINIEVNKTNFKITTGVDYFGDLVDLYDSNKILGINKDAMKDFLIDYTLPEIQKNFKAIISK